MRPDYVRLAVTMSEGPLCIFAFVTYGASPTLPRGAYWTPGNDGTWIRPATPENIAKEFAKAFPPGRPQPVSWRVLAPDEIPEDVSFRNAWIDDNGRVGHDMAKAREIQKARIRAARMPVLDELDRQHSRAVGQNFDQSELDAIEAKRKALRDAPADPRIAAATNITELRAVGLPDVGVEVPSGRRP